MALFTSKQKQKSKSRATSGILGNIPTFDIRTSGGGRIKTDSGIVGDNPFFNVSTSLNPAIARNREQGMASLRNLSGRARGDLAGVHKLSGELEGDVTRVKRRLHDLDRFGVDDLMRPLLRRQEMEAGELQEAVGRRRLGVLGLRERQGLEAAQRGEAAGARAQAKMTIEGLMESYIRSIANTRGQQQNQLALVQSNRAMERALMGDIQGLVTQMLQQDLSEIGLSQSVINQLIAGASKSSTGVSEGTTKGTPSAIQNLATLGQGVGTAAFGISQLPAFQGPAGTV